MRLGLALLAVVAAAGASAQFYGDYKDSAVPGQARVATDAASVGVHIEQRLNEFVPMDAEFADETGRPRKFRDVFQGRPVVVLPMFYKCTGVCDNALSNLIKSFKGFRRDFIGQSFDVVLLSIDPNETPTLASTKKDSVIAEYMTADRSREKRVHAEHGLHLLTGDLANIHKVTDALGFQYKYDETNGSIVHPAGIMVLSPTGRISRYFITTEFPQQVLLDSIRDAGKDLVGVKDDRPFFLACIQISPMTGQQTLNILNLLKVCGVLTVLSLGTAMWVWNRKYKAEHGGNL